MQTVLDAALEALAVAQHGLVARWQLKILGMARAAMRHRLASGRWREIHPGVYRFAGAPITPRGQLLAAVLSAGPRAVASHSSAAAIHGFPGFDFDDLVITVPRGVRPQNPVLTVHQSNALSEWHVTIRDSIPVTTVARTLFDGCSEWHPRRSERALDNALSRRWVTQPACWRVLLELAGPGRAGVSLMRALLLARGDGYVAPASELEARFLDLVRVAGLPLPARQVDVGDADAWIGRVDFLYRDAGLVIETDGRANHTALLDRASDRARDNRLSLSDRRVLRFTWGDITESPSEVVRLLRDALRFAA